MRRKRIKITGVFLLALMLCALAGRGCGFDGEVNEGSTVRGELPDGGDDEGKKRVNGGNTDGEESANGESALFGTDEVKAECEEGGTGEAKTVDYLTLQEKLRPSVLQIFCGDYRGSGVVWEITEEEVIVISSGHLLKNGETCEVLCYAGVYYEAKVDRILENCDVGFAVFPAKALEEDGVELTAVVSCDRGKEELVQGETLVVYGSMNGAAGDFVKGYLLEAEREMQFDEYDSPQYLMLGAVVREDGKQETQSGEEAGPVDAGMSGSGVFDGEGKLLGILAGGDGKSEFAAVPVWRILKNSLTVSQAT